MSRAKYRPGPVIYDPSAVVALILAGHPLYERHKVQTRGWLSSQHLRLIASNAKRGIYRIAIPIDKDAEK